MAARPPTPTQPDMAVWWPRLPGLVMSVHGRRVQSAGLDIDEICAEVVVRVLRKQAYDPTRASVATYLGTIARFVVLDMVRARQHDPLTQSDGVGGLSVVAAQRCRENQAADLVGHLREGVEALRGEALEHDETGALELIAQGYRRAEVLSLTGIHRGTYRRLRAQVGRVVRTWGLQGATTG